MIINLPSLKTGSEIIKAFWYISKSEISKNVKWQPSEVSGNEIDLNTLKKDERCRGLKIKMLILERQYLIGKKYIWAQPLHCLEIDIKPINLTKNHDKIELVIQYVTGLGRYRSRHELSTFSKKGAHKLYNKELDELISFFKTFKQNLLN